MNNDSLKKIGDKIEGMRSCLFVTSDAEGNLKARPMSTQEVVFDGSVWFMTDRNSNKCKEIAANPSVGLEYAHSNGVRFVSLSGKASLVDDRAKIHEFWNPFYKAWADGPDDEKLVLIEVKVSRAEYWDNAGGKLGALADMAIGAVTGNTNTLDEHEVVTL